MRLSIQRKAIAAISVLMVTLAFSLMAVSLYHSGDAIRDELLMRGRIATNGLAHNASYATLISDTTTLGDLLDGMMAEKEVLYARVVEPNGTVIASRERVGEGLPTYALQELRSQSSGATAPLAETVDDGEGIVHFQTPVMIAEEVSDLDAEIGIYDMAGSAGDEPKSTWRIIGYAQAGLTTRFIEETIDDMHKTMLWTTLLAVLFATLITSIMVRVSIRPINELVVATGRVAGGDYDVKVTTPVRNDEVGDLATSFNKMTADLKASRNALVEKELLEDLVAELKETQQQLVQAGKMAAVGQLAAGVAHEINNPLAGIMGYAQLAAEHIRARQTTGIPPSEVHRFLGYIENMEKQSQRCKQIVQNLLRFARASTHEEPEPVDVNHVVRETLSFLSHQMVSNGVQLDSRLADPIPAIKGHAGKLQQILTNILINALQAIRSGEGRVVVETSVADNWVTIRITDTGEGIPEENLDKIFEPFFTTKEIGQGTGLGLSVTYGLVKDMGGNIAVESQVGKGTTFTVAFPVMEMMDGPSRAASVQGPQESKESANNAKP
jgi:signal transduction histidine kinase